MASNDQNASATSPPSSATLAGSGGTWQFVVSPGISDPVGHAIRVVGFGLVNSLGGSHLGSDSSVPGMKPVLHSAFLFTILVFKFN